MPTTPRCDLFALATALQRFACAVMLGGRSAFPCAVRDLLPHLPTEVTGRDELAVRGLLLKTAREGARTIHQPYHATTDVACHFSPEALLDVLFSIGTGRPQRAFSAWARRLETDLDRAHPYSAVERVVGVIDERFHERLKVSLLARTIGAHPSHLRVAFKRRYGITIHEYQTLLRLRTGLRMLGESDAKVETVARAVGYRSAKDFYRGVRDLTGLTPRAARGLDPASMAGLFSRLLRIQ